MSSETSTQDWLREQIRRQITAVLGGMTGQEPAGQWREDVRAEEQTLTWQLSFSTNGRESLWIQLSNEAVQVLGDSILGDGQTPVSTEECRSTILEIFGQIGSAIARDLSGKLGHEILAADSQVVEEAPPTAPENLLVEIAPSGIVFKVWTEQIRQLCALEAAAKKAAPPTPAPAPSEAPAAPQRPSKTMDLLLDVEMPVSISFGRAQLALKDVLKLSSGSIVELNRAIIEPVEVIVNNCVIARGEVVVVEGNYGVKIQQIISRQDRLRTLH